MIDVSRREQKVNSLLVLSSAPLLILAAVALNFAAPLEVSAAPVFAQLSKRADEELKKGYYRAAIETYREILKKQPKDASALFGLAHSYKKNGQFQESIPIYKAALKQDPDHRGALLELSEMLAWKDDTRPQAVTNLTRLVELEPGNYEAQKQLGIVQSWNATMRPDAINHLQIALKLNPSDAEATLALARVLNWSGRYAAAEPIYREYIKTHEYDFAARAEFAQMLSYVADKRDEAVLMLRSLVTEQKNNSSSRFALAQALSWNKQYDEAISILQKVVAEEPANLAAHQELGSALKIATKYNEALSEFDYVLRRSPDDRPALLGKAVVLAKLNRPAEALAIFQKISAKLSDNAEFLNEYGQTLLAQKRPGEAAQQFERTLMLGGTSSQDKAEAHLGLSYASILKLDFKEAAAQATTALGLEPDSVSGIRLLTGALLGQDKLDLAESSFARLPESARADQNSLKIEGEIAKRKRDWPKALAIYKRLLGEGANDAAVRSNYAIALIETGDFKAAEPILADLLNQPGADPILNFHFARALALQGKTAEALVAAKKGTTESASTAEAMQFAQEYSAVKVLRPLAVEVTRTILVSDPKSADARFLLAKLLSWDESTQQEAVTQLETYLKLHGDNTEVQKQLAEVLSWTGQRNRSLQLFGELQSKEPSDIEVKINKAKVLSWKGKLSEAATLYRSVLVTNPQDKWALLGLGQCASWSGDCFRAEAFFKTGMDLYPEDTELQAERAMNFRQMGRLDKAAALIAQALKSVDKLSGD